MRMNKFLLAIIVALIVFSSIKSPSWSVWSGALLFIILLYSMTFAFVQKIDYDDFGKYGKSRGGGE